MKKSSILILIVMLLPLTVCAAQVYGSLKINGQPLQQGVLVEVFCDGKKSAEGRTDQYGGYNLYVGNKGKCIFKVNYSNGPTHEVYSYDNPARYDFDLVNVNGQYELRRR